MELVTYYLERIKPHVHRRNIELAAAVFILLCSLFVLLTSLPRKSNVKLNDGTMVYEGQVVRYKMSGKGTLTYANGDSYDGQFLNGSFNGKGIFKSESGWIYEGEFVNGLAHGEGKLTTETGIVYEGQFEKGLSLIHI